MDAVLVKFLGLFYVSLLECLTLSASGCSFMYALVLHKPTLLLKEEAAVILVSQPFIPTPLPSLLLCRQKCELNWETDLH